MDSRIEQLRAAMLDLLENGRFAEAEEQSREALEEFPGDARLTMLLGLAQVQSGKTDLGLAHLKQATELDPTDSEAFANVASAMIEGGDRLEAKSFVEQSLRLDPSNLFARQLESKLDQPDAQASFIAGGDKLQSREEARTPGPDRPQTHVLNLGPAWTRIGFALVAYCVVSFTVLIFHPFVSATGMRPDPLSRISFFLYITSGLACVFWTLVDVIDRREKFVWLLPIWICGFAALPVLPMCVYLAFRNRSDAVSLI